MNACAENRSGTCSSAVGGNEKSRGRPFTVGFATRACGKELSEDFFDMACPTGNDRQMYGQVFALADGLSGGGGRRAAETCVRAIVSDFYATSTTWEVERRLERIIGAVNAWLLAHNAQQGRTCMLSTLSVLVLAADCFHIGHVGDCRIYRLRGGQCERLTTDHVWPRTDMRHVLRRAVGLDEHLVVDCFSEELQPGDRFLMATDGVWEVLGEKDVCDALSSSLHPQELADLLVQRSVEKQRGYYGRNDATAAVIEVAGMLAAPLDGRDVSA